MSFIKLKESLLVKFPGKFYHKFIYDKYVPLSWIGLEFYQMSSIEIIIVFYSVTMLDWSSYVTVILYF